MTAGRIGACALALLLASGAVQAKTLVFCSEGDPETLNPQMASTGLGTNASRPMFDTLVQSEPGTTEIIPSLAQSWTVSPDGRAYTFHLRPGVPFHTEERFTPTRALSADDVVFSFERQWRADNPFHKPAEGAFDYFADLGMADILQGIDKIDDLTVRFRLTRPEAPFLTDLAMPWAMILSHEYAEAMLKAGTPARLDKEPIGTGPFEFKAYRPGLSLNYQAFDRYWAGRPAIDNLVFSITSNAAVRLNKLKAGECQVMALPNPRDAAEIVDNPQLTLMREEGLNIGYLALNVTKPPFNDARVRRAVHLAIDKPPLIQAVFGGAGVSIDNPLPRNLWSYNDQVRGYAYDPAQAQRLMLEAGLADGFDTEIYYMPISRPYNPASSQMAEMMADDLSRIGIRAKLVTDEWSRYRAKLQAGAAPMALYGWIGDNGDPDNFLAIILGCHDGKPGPGNIVKWCNPEFDRLIAQGKLITDRRQREALYRQAQQVVHDEAAILPIAQSSVLMAVRKTVRGFKVDPLGRYIFDRVDLDE